MLRQELGLPRFVVVEDDDNTLPVDLENVLSIETFAQLVRDRKSVKLVELLSTADALCVHGPEGRFAHELVIPMLRRREPTTLAPRPLRPGAVTRRFPPGSEWLYAKFYGGRASVDQILTGPVAQVVRDLAGAFDRWFFLRYADPDWHLRLRFHGAPERLHGELLPALETAAYSLLGDGRGWRLQLDTYEREVERYGGDEGVALSERLFHVDAEAVLAIVELLSGDEGADARWRLTLCGIDALLDNSKFDLAARRRLMKKLRNSLGDEPRFVGGIERQLGSHFRRHRHELEALLDHTREAHSNLAPAIELFDRRSERLVPIVAELEDAARRGRLTCTIEELTVSYLHMHANRLLRSAHRDQELVIYDFLNRLYDSQAARLTR